METPHKTFSPFLWIGAVLLVIVVVLAARKHAWQETVGGEGFSSDAETGEIAQDISSQSVPVTHEGYEAAVTAILAQYQSTQDATVAQQALLAMRVPSEDRDTHEALVTLLGKAAMGDKTDADTRYAELKTTVTWLP